MEGGYRNDRTHSFRQQYLMVLLKSEKRTSLEVAAIVGGCEMTVNNWLVRYRSAGINGLQTRPGRGRKAIFQAADLELVKAAVKQSRQRISVARAELETSLGKGFSQSSLVRYLKKNGCRYKRIIKRLRDKPLLGVYRLRKEVLGELETFSEAGLIDLFYGDEAGVNLEPCVPYGW